MTSIDDRASRLEGQVAQLLDAAVERDAKIAERDAKIADRDTTITERDTEVAKPKGAGPGT